MWLPAAQLGSKQPHFYSPSPYWWGTSDGQMMLDRCCLEATSHTLYKCEPLTARPIINRQKHPVHKSSTRTVLLTGGTSQRSSSGHGPGLRAGLSLVGSLSICYPLCPSRPMNPYRPAPQTGYSTSEFQWYQPLTTGSNQPLSKSLDEMLPHHNERSLHI
jgi:hypothetical protein